jgi:hypothetical protein
MNHDSVLTFGLGFFCGSAATWLFFLLYSLSDYLKHRKEVKVKGIFYK